MKLLAAITNPVLDEKYGNIRAMDEGGPLALFVVNLWRTMIILGTLATLIYLIWGAFEWITSQGDSKKLEAARNKMIHAVAGLGFLAASVAIVYLINALDIFGFNLLKLEWPTP